MGEKPRRLTRQQQAVSDILDARGDFRSAQAWQAALKEDGSPVGLATVYRTLQSLADAGRIDVLRTAAGESLYRACSATIWCAGNVARPWKFRPARSNGGR